MDLNQYQLTDAERNGVWVEIGDARFLLASSRLDEFTEAQQEGIEKNREVIRKGFRKGASPEERAEARKARNRINREAMAAHLIKGWEGITDNGQAVPFSPEKAAEIVERFPLLARELQSAINEAFSVQLGLDIEGIENAKNG